MYLLIHIYIYIYIYIFHASSTVPYYIMNVLLHVMHILNAHSAYSNTLHRFMSPIQTHEHYTLTATLQTCNYYTRHTAIQTKRYYADIYYPYSSIYVLSLFLYSLFTIPIPLIYLVSFLVAHIRMLKLFPRSLRGGC